MDQLEFDFGGASGSGAETNAEVQTGPSKEAMREHVQRVDESAERTSRPRYAPDIQGRDI